MPNASKVMIGFGTILVLGGVIGWNSPEASIASGVAIGLVMIAAGAAAAQGRTSLRKTGYFIGFFLPVLCAGYYGWQAIRHWRIAQPFPAILLTVMALAGLLTLLVLMRLRSGDNIAERGYSVLPLSTQATEAPPQPKQPVDRR